MEGGLFVAVIVILIAGDLFRGRQAERLRGIWILIEQAGTQEVVYTGRTCAGGEWNLTGEVGCLRISPEVMIEGNIFLENYDHVLDWSFGLGSRWLRPKTAGSS